MKNFHLRSSVYLKNLIMQVLRWLLLRTIRILLLNVRSHV